MKEKIFRIFSSNIKIRVSGRNINNFIKRIIKNNIKIVKLIPRSHKEIDLIIDYNDLEEIEKYKTDVTINATKLEEIQKEIKGFEKVDLTAKIQEFNNKKQELENMRRQQMEYHRIFENNNRILVDLQTNSKKLDS